MTFVVVFLVFLSLLLAVLLASLLTAFWVEEAPSFRSVVEAFMWWTLRLVLTATLLAMHTAVLCLVLREVLL